MAGKLILVAATGLLGAAVFLALGAGLAGRDLLRSGRLQGLGMPACSTATAAGSASGSGTSSGARQRVLPIGAGEGAGEGLAIALPASVTYQPGGAAEAVVEGDPALVSHVWLDGRTLRLDCDPGWFANRLSIRVSGPAIADWALLGSGDLALNGLDQPRLRLQLRGSGSISSAGSADEVEVDLSGSGNARLTGLSARSAEVSIRGSGTVTAAGSTRQLGVQISGSGDALLRNLTAQSARIRIRGSGDAEVRAEKDADVSIAGSGDVSLSGHPVLLRSKVTGSGSISQDS